MFYYCRMYFYCDNAAKTCWEKLLKNDQKKRVNVKNFALLRFNNHLRLTLKKKICSSKILFRLLK
ncbi:hypothetical protein A8C56_00610 [Niabella ginsenosidivorans]|uniref:Uncharacterized protein n=1 Tax=Niabella ginsenosidivorans TaxID=1176587 RepID=A0A1A9HWR0_9BACT|nr:hypothetical protein A8C56_00610 [Niabella ginsenosidivorans]